MHFLRLISVSILLVAAVTGCRTTSNDRCERAIALLRAEKIDLEDKYYSLEAKYERLLSQSGYADDFRYRLPGEVIGGGNEIQIIGGELLSPGYESDHRDNGHLPAPQQQPEGSSNRSYGNPAKSASTEIPEIVIDTGDFSVLDPNLGVVNHQPSSVHPTVALPSPNNLTGNPVQRHRNNAPARAQRSPLSETELARHITDVVVDCDLQGLREPSSWLIVQPVDRGQAAIPLRGEVTLSVLDPNQPAAQQRVGMWTYAASRVATWIRDDGQDIPGIHVPKPASLRFRDFTGLVAFVRYKSVDGQVFETSLELDGAVQVADQSGGGLPAKQSANSNAAQEPTPASSESEGELEWRPHR